MKYNFLVLMFIFVVSCKNIPSSKPNLDYVPYKNSGFALIYNPDLHKNEKFYKQNEKSKNGI